MNIKEDYVSFETAKLLKEKGFDEKCQAMYDKDGHLAPFNFKLLTKANKRLFVADAPTHQMALKWLREVHNIFIQIDYVVLTKTFFEYTYEIHNMHKGRSIAISEFRDNYETYEEAVEAAIKYCLTNLIK